MRQHIVAYLLFLATSHWSCSSTSAYHVASESFGHNSYQEGMPFAPGKCFSKCSMPDEYDIETYLFPMYVGNESYEKVDIDTIEIQTKPASTRWEKRKTDMNCRSRNPDDCLVWCLIEEPAEMEIIPILLDTSQSPNFEWTEVKRKVLIRQKGFTAWKEVICEKEITRELYLEISKALNILGYLEKVSIGKTWGNAEKSALLKYQRENDLPIGGFNLDTMRSLNVYQ